MRTNRSILTALTACVMLTTACARPVPPSAIPRAPQREMPATARQACALPLLPATATWADLEEVVVARGAALIACDVARQLAVDVHDAEHADEAAWLNNPRTGPR